MIALDRLTAFRPTANKSTNRAIEWTVDPSVGPTHKNRMDEHTPWIIYKYSFTEEKVNSRVPLIITSTLSRHTCSRIVYWLKLQMARFGLLACSVFCRTRSPSEKLTFRGDPANLIIRCSDQDCDQGRIINLGELSYLFEAIRQNH